MDKLQTRRMELDIKYDCTGVDWSKVCEILGLAGMAHGEPEQHRLAWEASHTTVFAYRARELIGFGRAISDGVFQAAVYEVAVIPAFQHQGVGTVIMRSIFTRLPNCNVILYASPGKEPFYQTLGMRKLKTGLALFRKADHMSARGITE